MNYIILEDMISICTIPMSRSVFEKAATGGDAGQNKQRWCSVTKIVQYISKDEKHRPQFEQRGRS
jgi:hypothetical protein